MSGTIEVKGLVKTFGDQTAVAGVSFEVQAGQIFGLLGPSGAGKSTLLRVLVTLLPPTAGSAAVNGFDVVQRPDDVRHSIGLAPQAMTGDLELTVEEHVLIFTRLHGVPPSRGATLAADLIGALELTPWADTPVTQLPGAMRLRLEIARGLVREPRVFVFDEPTAGLDPASRRAAWTMLRTIKTTWDLTLLVATSDQDEADALCDRIAIMEQGRLTVLDTPAPPGASLPGHTA